MTTEVERSESKRTEENEHGTADNNDDGVIKAVAERLRFFFSDANVRSDHFMRQKLLKSEGGYVPIELLLRFNSIKMHTTDPKVIAQAAKTLCSGGLVLSEDCKSIARVKPFTMSMMDDNIPLSLYVSNLPIAETTPPEDEGKKRHYAVSLGELRALFEPYGDVSLVKLQFQKVESEDDKSKKKYEPTGGAFVEFETVEQQQKALEDLAATKNGEAVDPKTKLTLGGNTLEVTSLREWIDAKKKSKAAKNTDEEVGSKKRDREEVPEAEIVVKEFKLDWKPGCVIQLKGLSESCDREAIRSSVAKGLELTEDEIVEKGIYADFSRGQTEGAIRFREPSESISALAAKLANGDIEIAGAKVESASILKGEEEEKYWANFFEFKNKQVRHKAEEKAMKRSRRGRH